MTSSKMRFQNILEKYRKIAFSERDKGDRFERLMQAYLKSDPKYAYLFKNVWLWNEFPGKLDLGGSDTGIDLVALTHEGDYWAIQCKCYQEGTTIDKPAVDSFLSTSSREFKNENQETTRFSQRMWIDTTGRKWGSNAEEAIHNQNPTVTRLRLFDLIEAPVDWEKLENGIHGEISRTPKKTLRPHQREALEKTHEYFKSAERGKLIMACGTGKTFNSLRIAEKETDGNGLILFLVPSIALLGQTLREWSADANEPINAICICSDPEVSKKKTKNDDTDRFSVVDLAMPASTNVREIIHQFGQILRKSKSGMTVVFSTYQSIEVIAKAQKELQKEQPDLAAFDLIICDEAHRTTGVTLSDEDESAFTKVHDNNFIKAKKRLYMTATPRLYSDDIKSKAAQADAVLCSMDDAKLYGEEIYRIGFGEAVDKDLLTDYKVLILTLSDKDVPPAVQNMIADREYEINTDDASKLIGCINALSKQILGDEGIIKDTDPEPMRRAVAFCSSIAVSKKITAIFNTATDAYISSLPAAKKEKMVSVGSLHVDGTMSAPQRDELLGWLKTETQDNECRILTNVRCLSEGVDVPSLDAVMFLSARNSQVDVVQSVGRVMRKAPGKKYGYIIIPVVVPSDVDAARALDDNERYKVVWTVLNALRAHDDRFNATVNKIELNRNKPQNILVGRPEYSFDRDGAPRVVNEGTDAYGNAKDISNQLALQFEQLQSVVFARMVQKVGDRRYWEQWAKNVAEIAERQVARIIRLIKDEGKHQQAFEQFLKGLQRNINPGISEQEAVEMLSQHVITKPVFEALFEGYSFVRNNPVSVSMQTMLDLLEAQAVEKDTETLHKFYESVKMRASGIDNAEGRQRIIVELYDKFFKTAFPKMVEQLGIVYTPVEVVDFIIRSADWLLKKEFDRCLSDENIHVLDPFTGTGTFITRLLQSGLIRPEDLERKYRRELHANEIVLLAYYIAAVNIENAYHDAVFSSPPAPLHIGEGSMQTVEVNIPTTLLEHARELRKKQTKPEELLWQLLRNRQLSNLKFRRQHPLKVNFILDFYCAEAKLGIEVDGGYHKNADQQEYDKLRTEIISQYGIRIIRFTNEEILNDTQHVLDTIIQEATHPLSKMERGQGGEEYTPFDGICLTDTFQLSESDDIFSEKFPQNSERVLAQKNAPLRVIIGNPPYSVGQKSANDNAQNQAYPKLDARIGKTYAALSKATNKNSLYDSYIKAFRWSADRLDAKHGGIIAFVSNGAWLDDNSKEGFRKCLEKEFSSIYVFNLRGNQRTSGELSRKEGGKIFGSGSRTPIAVTFLVKKPNATGEKCTIYYHDIGDYLNREEKLKIIDGFRSIENEKMGWQVLQPNEHGDWLNLRDDAFGQFLALGDKDDKDNKQTFFISLYSNGVKTQRDAWCYNSSKAVLESNIQATLNFYNEQSRLFSKAILKDSKIEVKSFLNYDSKKISWTRALEWDVEKGKIYDFDALKVVVGVYRPFFKQKMYFARELNEMVYQIPKLFPTPTTQNLVICVSGVGASKDFSALISDCIPNLHFLDSSQCFPLYYYEEKKSPQGDLFSGNEAQWVRHDGVSDFIHARAQRAYGEGVTKEDIFYYVYGFLHSPAYRERFSSDLKKMLPRLPLVESPQDFWAFSRAGRELARWHLGYETAGAPEGVLVNYDPAHTVSYRVEKMRFATKTDKSVIVYNPQISIEHIPAEAYEYVVNGKPAIEWVMERYAVTTHKDSGIRNDPNDWAAEAGNPKYILEVLLGVIRVSLETMRVVKGLPRLEF